MGYQEDQKRKVREAMVVLRSAIRDAQDKRAPALGKPDQDEQEAFNQGIADGRILAIQAILKESGVEHGW